MIIKIEAATQSDLSGINDIYNHYILESNATFDTEEWSIERRTEWFHQFNSDESSYNLLVAKQGDEVLGFAYNYKFKEKPAYFTSSEVTVYVSPVTVNSGLGTELYRHLMSRIEGSEIHRLYAGIALPNDASVRLHEKHGFNLVGTQHEVGYKNGRFHSVSLYEKKLTR